MYHYDTLRSVKEIDQFHRNGHDGIAFEMLKLLLMRTLGALQSQPTNPCPQESTHRNLPTGIYPQESTYRNLPVQVENS